jgi:hypothetical protein
MRRTREGFFRQRAQSLAAEIAVDRRIFSAVNGESGDPPILAFSAAEPA